MIFFALICVCRVRFNESLIGLLPFIHEWRCGAVDAVDAVVAVLVVVAVVVVVVAGVVL